MNLAEIFDTTFEENEVIKLDNDEIISESFLLSPLVAFLAFKDDVIKKAGNAAEKVTSPIDKIAGQVDRVKAKLEINSGKKANDTAYKLTKEQKKFLTYIYKKYGNKVVKEIQKFRTNIAAPYQVIKRSVAKNRTLTDKEVHGMTKEEYERYRESGAKKIQKMGNQFEDFKVVNKSASNIKAEKDKLQELYNNVKNGKGTINPSQVEKILEKIGYGSESFKKWPPEELRATANKIAELERDLKQPQIGGRIKLSSKKKNGTLFASEKDIKNDISYLKEFGYSAYAGKRISSDTKKGEFKEAFNNYVLRNLKKSEIESQFQGAYRSLYVSTLKDELDKIEKKYKNSIDDVSTFAKGYKLNDYESKIWGLKPTGVKHSGDLSDWYLKIKPEDFKGVKNFKKSNSVIKAEKEFDKELKAFERKMKNIISEDDWNLLLKHRLVNNFLTVKELKNTNGMFKDEGDFKNISSDNYNLEEFKSEIDECKSKTFTSFKELESKQKEMKKKISLFFGKEQSEAKKYAAEFLSRSDTGDKSDKTSNSDYNDVVDFVNKVNETTYTNVKFAQSDLKTLESKMNVFKAEHPNDTSKINAISYSVEKARDKLNAFIKNGEYN